MVGYDLKQGLPQDKIIILRGDDMAIMTSEELYTLLDMFNLTYWVTPISLGWERMEIMSSGDNVIEVDLVYGVQ